MGAHEEAVGMVFVSVGMLELGLVGAVETWAVPTGAAEGALVMQAYRRLPLKGNGWMDRSAAHRWAGYSVQSEQIDPPPPVWPRRFLAR